MEEILKKYDCLKRPAPLTAFFEEIENLIGFVLPDDYGIYLQRYLPFEGFIGPEFMRLWSFEELIDANKDYYIFENLPYTLAIGNNGSSEFIALELTADKNVRVVISPFIDLDEEYHIEIGKSFTDFLRRLDNGKEWFE